MKRSVHVPLLAALVALAPPAHAEANAEAKAAAQQLYDDAGKLMHAQQWSEACPKLEASQKLDPGTGTAYRLAYCYAGAGKTASAWAMFVEVEGAARRSNDRRADDAATQAKLLEPKLARMLIEVAPEQRAGIEIRRDGKALDPTLWSSAVPIDPGEHTIDAAKPGKQPWQTKITVTDGPGVTTVHVPALADAPASPPGPDADTPPFWGTQHIVGLTVGCAGVIGLAVGTAFGVMTLQKTSDANAYCSATLPYCKPPGLTLESDAKATAKVADATLTIGGAAVVGGLVLLLTRPSSGPKLAGEVRVAPAVGLGRAGISVEGRW